MGHLPRLLLPQRLANTTALELSWDICLSPVHSRPSWEDWPAYKAFIVIIASGFPSLKNLYISIQVYRYLCDWSATTIESYERKLLEPLDEMVRELSPKLQNCQIAPQRSLYAALKSRAESTGAHTESGGYGGLRWERFWRPLDMEPSKQTTNSLGYWVRQGRDDTPVSTSCFGT